MTAALTPVPKIQFFADDGTPLVGGKLYTYAAGTTTPLATYTTYAGTVANTNPVILDSRGEANVWLTSGVLYKLALYDADNALIWTVDNVSGGDTDLRAEQKKNYNWMGFFATWQNGHAFKTETTERVVGSSGATFSRLSFIDDQVTILHVKGTYQADAIRIQRNNTNANTQSATMVMNLTQTETLPLLGNNICVQLHALKSSTWTGSNLTVRVQYSKEPQQPVVLANGEYTSGQTVLVQNNFVLTTAMPAENAPYSVTATLPSDAVQVAIVVTVPWAGSAGVNDYVDIEGCLLTVGTAPASAIPEVFADLIVKAKTRYQTTYPYSAPRGATTKAGSLRVTAINTDTTRSVISSVRFDPPMAIIPQVLMQSPLSGTENRWENETTGVFVNGLPYNLSDQGVTLQNNGAVTAGDVLLCHWTARCVF